MKSTALVMLLLAAGSFAQNAIPAGTILPVQLNSSLRSKRAQPGQIISARVMQDVPLTARSKIRAGAKVIGHVVAVSAAGATGKSQISLRFDTVADGKKRIPVLTNLRALATLMDVSEAQVPEGGPDRGTSQYIWTTDQIGGEVVYHGALVSHGANVVGSTVSSGGVLARVTAKPGTGCRGAVEGNDSPQALWVFSSDACGIYDYGDVVLRHAGRTEPVGEIVLESDKRGLNIRAGSGMLLRVNRN